MNVQLGDGPPPEAYGRITNPERFRYLHDLGWQVVRELADRDGITRADFTEPDRFGPEPAVGVRLTPDDPAASPLTVVFESSPGIVLRTGGTGWMCVPMCSCDACDESVEECTQRVWREVDAVTSGTFGERLIHDDGWWHEHWYSATDRSRGSSSGRVVDDDRLAELRALMPDGALTWKPWRSPRRMHPERSDPA